MGRLQRLALVLGGGGALIGAIGLAGATFSSSFRSNLWFIEQRLLTPWLSPESMGSGGPATQILLCEPMGLALDSAGSVYVSDRGRGRRGRLVWRIDGDGLAHVVAGSGRMGKSWDATPHPVDLSEPGGVAVDRQGRVYFADVRRHAVFRIGGNQGIERIAGNGGGGFSGDGGPATEAMLNGPTDIRFDSEGNLYVADVLNHRVRRIDPGGTIHTVAGSGEAGFSGDGVSALRARLNMPWSIALTRDDRLLIADSENHRVRVVEADGTLRTLAGNGTRGYSGDGGPATEASFDTPQAIHQSADGRLFIDDEHNHAIRVVGLDGGVTTIMGTGSIGLAQEGDVATSAALNDPEDLLTLADGSVVVTDGDNGRVVRIGSDGRVHVLAGRSETSACQSRW